MKNSVLIVIITLLAVACQLKSNTEQGVEEAAKSPVLEKMWETDTTMSTAESVLYDQANNVLYVSCINGVPPNSKDGDGFIAKISPVDGAVIDQMWVTDLSAPKGMGLFDGTLYVTNIDELVAIDVASGEITNRYAVEGAQFLNDVTVDTAGVVYFSDSNTNKIHALNGDSISTWVAGEALGGPNGLLIDGDKLMLATFGVGNFNEIDRTTGEVKVVADSIPGGDGVVKTGDDFLVSNWNGEVYYVTADYAKTKILDTKDQGANAADIEIIAETNTLLVPTFFGNQVVAYKLKFE